jgi:hypothetical protein
LGSSPSLSPLYIYLSYTISYIYILYYLYINKLPNYIVVFLAPRSLNVLV